MSFKLPIELVGKNKAVYLVTVEGIYLIGLFAWDAKKMTHHEEFYILRSTPPAIKLRRELGAMQKDLQRLFSKFDTTGKQFINSQRRLGDKAFQLVMTYLQNPPTPIIPYTPVTNYIAESAQGWKEEAYFGANMKSGSRRMMRHLGSTMQGKSLDEMRTPKINTLRYIHYVSINYNPLPNRKRNTPILPTTLLKAMAREHLK